ncbi:hypothetical protein PR048_004072 [Dryococelus australis]|uniref:Secreted protein n=1 Tax=Dryococelus australis TaxID=614101 RepID=A0ABQ9I4G1_9NEOP|nr:hypothetical protein PR048_004072 [Dryococelus australis]
MRYIMQWVPATTCLLRCLVPRQLVYVKNSLSSSSRNFCAGFVPQWSSPHNVVKPLSYTTCLVKVSSRLKMAIHCDDLRLAMEMPRAETVSQKGAQTSRILTPASSGGELRMSSSENVGALSSTCFLLQCP